MLLWAVGLAGFGWAHVALIRQVEPFYTPVYSLLWGSYILLVDWLVWLAKGRSMLSDRPREFILLALWSSPLWLLFEDLNLRLQNWYYVQVPFDVFSFRFWAMMPAFMTVLPGVFETAELAEALIRRRSREHRITDRPIRFGATRISVLAALGAAMLALSMLWPRYCFCLVWGFAFLLLDPIVYLVERRRGEPPEARLSILAHLERGDATRLVALLLAGFVTGGLWELWNLGARTKWIYTVPGFEHLKIGEMPVLGFLGFPPFVLECYAIVNAIGLFRGGRSWARSGEENRARRGMGKRAAARVWLAVAAFWLASSLALLWHTVSSFSLPVDVVWRHRLKPEAVRWIRDHDVRRTHEFLKLTEIPREIDPALWLEMRAVSRLAEVRGMGLLYAAALYVEKVRTPHDLARMKENEVTEILARNLKEDQLPHRAQIRIWLRAANAPTPE